MEFLPDIVFGERHLRHVLLSYMNYYNETRTQPSAGRRDASISNRQYDLKPARCQRITVSGFKIARALRTLGAKRYSPANINRSKVLKFSRFGD